MQESIKREYERNQNLTLRNKSPLNINIYESNPKELTQNNTKNLSNKQMFTDHNNYSKHHLTRIKSVIVPRFIEKEKSL